MSGTRRFAHSSPQNAAQASALADRPWWTCSAESVEPEFRRERRERVEQHHRVAATGQRDDDAGGRRDGRPAPR